jgi:hypothetical protein
VNVGLPSETIKAAAVRIKQLEQENASLRADKERLDWLEGPEGLYWAAKRLYHGKCINRADIDAAIKEAQP